MKTTLGVADAPAAIGPYSQAQVVRLHGGNRMVFTSGQIALDPKSGKLQGTDVAAQTERVFENLKAILRGTGLTLDDVVKTTVFLADMDDFAAMNEVYARQFPADPPARSTIGASGLPKGALVEIEAVAMGRDL